MVQKILLGVCGSVAAYKVPELVRLLLKQGFQVKVVLSPMAKEFVAPLALKAICNDEVYVDEDTGRESLLHIRLSKWADVLLLSPVSAQTLAKLSGGMAGNLLTSICLASKAPLILAPAMNTNMWEHAATMENVKTLEKRGAFFLGPTKGPLASEIEGEGTGRFLEPSEISELLLCYNPQGPSLQGKHMVITAGPTHEPLDPIRFLTNRGSGKMGVSLARAAFMLGAKVTLIVGPLELPPLWGIDIVRVKTAKEMHRAAKEACIDADIFIACASVGDYHVKDASPQKIKRSKSPLTLTLVPNVDIVKDIKTTMPALYTVAFCAETQNLLSYAREKLESKGCEMICANDVSRSDIGFSALDNEVTMIWRTQNGTIREEHLPKMSKSKVALSLLYKIHENIKEFSA